MAFLPRPFINPNLIDGAFTGQRKVQHVTNDGFGSSRYRERGQNSCSIGPIGRHSDGLEGFNQPIRHACIPPDQPGKAFRKNTLGTRSLATDPLAHTQFEQQVPPTKGDIGNGTLIAAVDTMTTRPTLWARSC